MTRAQIENAARGGIAPVQLRAARPQTGAAFAVLMAAATLSVPAHALEEPAGEWPQLEACEKKLCTMILDKKAQGEDLTCSVSKTWASDTIKGGESKSVKWGFGDARCTTSVKLTNADVVNALTKPAHAISVSKQAVRCEIERDGELKPVTAVASPRIEFKNGKADKIWINLEQLDGPADVKGTIWTAAELEDTLGIFHRNMVKQVNKFMTKRCWEKYGPGAAAYALREAKKAELREKRLAKIREQRQAEIKAARAAAKAARSQSAESK
jgi:hypothetical protein